MRGRDVTPQDQRAEHADQQGQRADQDRQDEEYTFQETQQAAQERRGSHARQRVKQVVQQDAGQKANRRVTACQQEDLYLAAQFGIIDHDHQPQPGQRKHDPQDKDVGARQKARIAGKHQEDHQGCQGHQDDEERFDC